MSNIRLYVIAGCYWLGVERDGVVHLISFVGMYGDCVRH